MTARKLPTKLRIEPLIDVVCGVQFSSNVPAEVLLPGLLLTKLVGKEPKFETLPAAQLPQIVRDNDPNLQNAPLMRVVVDEKFTILIGSKGLAVGCQMPYAGWAAFKEMIQTVFEVLEQAPFIVSVERYSLKYVDFFKSQGAIETLSRFKLRIEIGGRTLSDQATQVRTEIVEPPFLHAITILSPATVNQPGRQSGTGAILDVDTHRLEKFEIKAFLERLPQFLDEIHLANKTVFFDLLSEAGLTELDPQYD